jgi:hypothetical protein
LSAVVVTSENSEQFYAERLHLEPAVAVTEEVKTGTEPVVESGEKTEAKTPEAEPEQSEGKQRINLRFSELTEKAKKAEELAAKAAESEKAAKDRADAAERRAAELQSKYEPPKADPIGPRPERAQFVNDEEWGKALEDYAGEKALRDREVRDAQTRIAREWATREAAFKAATPDYDAVIQASAELVVSEKVKNAILESEVGPQILHHLAGNPGLVADLKTKGDDWALRKVGALEGKFEALPKTEPKTEAKTEPKTVAATEISRAPAPIQPLRTMTATDEPLVDATGVFHGSYAQYKAARKAGKIT